MFRFKYGVDVSKERQGYIYYTSLNYKLLGARRQEKILKLCQEAGGEHWQALFDFVTTEEGATAICARYYLGSATTLYRAVKKYYEGWPENL